MLFDISCVLYYVGNDRGGLPGGNALKSDLPTEINMVGCLLHDSIRSEVYCINQHCKISAA